jgi:hypothetical protein
MGTRQWRVLKAERPARERGPRTGTVRRFVATLFTLVALLCPIVLASPASAGGPTREFVPSSDFTLEAGVCPFAVDFHVIANQEYALTFTDADGNPVRQVVTGLLVVQATNHDDPQESVTLNVSGPGEFQFLPDGAVVLSAWGSWLLFFSPGMLGPGSEGMIMHNNGFIQLRFNLDGTQTILRRSGAVEDVCATLS